jgi:hypothetical protein
MTTASPEAVKYVYYARIGSTDLPVTNIIASMDRDRSAYTTATLELDWIDDATFAALDPRGAGTHVEWNVEQQNESGTRIGQLPNVTSSGTPVKASMWVRDVTRNPLTGTARVELAGGESLLQDKRLLEIIPFDTGAEDLQELIWWNLDNVFGSYTITFDGIYAATALPAGRRREMDPGQDHLSFMQTEFDSINGRLCDDWGIEWFARERDDTDGTVDLSTYILTGSDHIVYDYEEHVGRDGEWYDGALIAYDDTDAGGSLVHERSTLGGVAGANNRGFNRTERRPAPAGNGAEELAKRMRKRGYDITITARARFDFDAQWIIDLNMPGPVTKTANIRSITWNIAESSMVIRAQSGTEL